VVFHCLVGGNRAHHIHIWPRQEPPRPCLICGNDIHPDQLFVSVPSLTDDSTREDDKHYERLLALTGEWGEDNAGRIYALGAAQHHTDMKLVEAVKRLQTEASGRLDSSPSDVMHAGCVARGTECQSPDCRIHHPIRAWWRRHVAHERKESPESPESS
jgi:hypothetical protein